MLNSSVVFSRSSANLIGFLRNFCKNVEYCEKTKCVVLLKDDFKFPAVWLRDNCQCSECFHNDSNSRTIMWKDFNVNVKPLEVQVQKNFYLFVTNKSIIKFFFSLMIIPKNYQLIGQIIIKPYIPMTG